MARLWQPRDPRHPAARGAALSAWASRDVPHPSDQDLSRPLGRVTKRVLRVSRAAASTVSRGAERASGPAPISTCRASNVAGRDREPRPRLTVVAAGGSKHGKPGSFLVEFVRNSARCCGICALVSEVRTRGLRLVRGDRHDAGAGDGRNVDRQRQHRRRCQGGRGRRPGASRAQPRHRGEFDPDRRDSDGNSRRARVAGDGSRSPEPR